MTAKKISIIVPSYNYADFIGEAIESVLAQTYKNWELIIVDDGSKDNSIEIIKNYVESNDNIYFFQHPNNENKGLKETLKLGLEKVKGEFTAFLESDDYWHEDYLAEKIKITEKHPEVKFIFNSVEYFGDEKIVEEYNRLTVVNTTDGQRNDTYEWLFCSFFNMSVVATFSSVMVDTKVLRKCDFNTPYNVFLDWWLYHQIALKHKMYCINQKLTYWRLHKKSYTNEKYNKDNQKKIELFYKKLCQNYIKNIFSLDISLNKKFKLLVFLIFKWTTTPQWLHKIFRGSVKSLEDWAVNLT